MKLDQSSDSFMELSNASSGDQNCSFDKDSKECDSDDEKSEELEKLEESEKEISPKFYDQESFYYKSKEKSLLSCQPTY
ncbi:hypothetical protein F8M41_001933 [Gigaspora margarita]|uniref:Uncharacterized protein n=1 Tax=Gigaspora margarita TaxID=4874 RepID=A0A8H4AYX5_GIGMA|nr:hypothetical protein F8M41_001933 [Gigaspora margarita]